MRDVPVRSLGAVFVAMLCAASLAATTRTVTNTNDSGPGSLRQAILDSNAAPGFDIIEFAIPGSGVQTIAVASPLPVTDGLYINGYSQPGSAPSTTLEGDNAVIEIELQGSGTDGLEITGGSAVIHGLALYGFDAAIKLSDLTDVVIAGNFIGLTAGGSVTLGNTIGVLILDTDGTDRIGDVSAAGRNVISGNEDSGIWLSGTKHKLVEGNLIGLALDGHSAAPNGIGIKLDTSESDTIGGTDVSYANFISGNTTDGIFVTGEQQILIQSNFIGTDVDGEAPLPNGGRGIRVEGDIYQGVIRQNVVSGNAGDGLSFNYTLLTPNTAGVYVYANSIGTDPGATTPIPNGGAGVWTQAAASLAIGLNTIAFNAVGIWETAPTDQESVTFDQNAIYSNHGLGIVIGPDARIVPNTPGGLWNFPFIVHATISNGITTIVGDYSGPPNTDVSLQFFTSTDCAKMWPKQFDEGAVYLGPGSVSTDGNGNGSFNVQLPFAVPDGVMTATATATVFVQQGGMTVATSHTSGFTQRVAFSVIPPSGDPAGASVQIAGTDLADVSSVAFGGEEAAGFVVDSATQISATTPALAPGTASEVDVSKPSGLGAYLPLGFVADFLDVPPSNPVHDYVVTLASDGITGGVGGGNYGVGNSVLRQQMVVFLLKAKHGICYAPPPCSGTFADVPCPSTFADWIEALAAEGITGGCGGGDYCPQGPVRRDQMAAFLLKAEHGSAYVPPPCSGTFTDVACPSLFADWIERLAAEGVTAGCGGGNYCPLAQNTRGQMAVFLTKTFQLP